MATDNPSVRDSLTSAMTSLQDAGAPDPAPAEGIQPSASIPDPAAEVAPVAADGAGDGPVRDEKGRFAPKEISPETAESAPEPAAPTSEANPETAAQAEPEPPKEAIRVPPSLPAAVKAKFAKLEPDVQEAFRKLEDSVQTSKAEWGKKGERLNRFEEIVGPRREQMAIRGIDEFQAIQTLFAAQDLLDRNPVGGLLELARSYGVTAAHLAQAAGLPQTSAQPGAREGGYAPTPQPDLASALRPLIEPLERQFQTLQQQLESERSNTALQAVEEFANHPDNLYFENVKDRIVGLLESGQAQNLKDAYDQACWMDPDIRRILLDQERARQTSVEGKAAAEAARKAEEAARAKARSSSHAAGSVTGAPIPGAQAPKAPPGSVRDTLKAAFQEHGAAV